MNFLAHMYLSGEDPEMIVGNYVADFITNKELKDYPAAVQRGVMIHRKIDTFTDQDPIVKESTQRLRTIYHKYAPVVIDILYDYVLAKNWKSYSTTDLQEFCNLVYKSLESAYSWMPEKLSLRTSRMIDDNWLIQYGTEAGIKKTFGFIERRTTFPANFEKVFDYFMDDYDLYEKEFNRFFPKLIQYVKEEQNKLN